VVRTIKIESGKRRYIRPTTQSTVLDVAPVCRNRGLVGAETPNEGELVKIAFLGLGRMGRELAAHIADKANEHDLVVWDRTRSAADELIDRGARRADSAAAAVAGVELVITALFGADAVREVVTSPNLVEPGTTWVDVTTVSPADADEFVAWANARGVRYVHSPVVGSLAPARHGQLGVLLGGDPAAVDIAKPVVTLWADRSRMRFYDTAAKAATDKLVNNLSLAVAMQGFVEALRLGHSGGLSTEQVMAALDKSMLSSIKDLKAATVRSADFSDTQFSSSLLVKDSGLMVHTSRHPLPALTAAYESLASAVRAGRGEDDFAVMAAADARD
jgi:3-hydroxyisobutyrate dehydrogenase